MKAYIFNLHLDAYNIHVRSLNIVAEGAVKLMEELHSTGKTDKYLNRKFINSNSEI